MQATLMDCEKNKYLLPTASKPLIYLRFLKSYNYTPTNKKRAERLFFCCRKHFSPSYSYVKSTGPAWGSVLCFHYTVYAAALLPHTSS